MGIEARSLCGDLYTERRENRIYSPTCIGDEGVLNSLSKEPSTILEEAMMLRTACREDVLGKL